MRMRYMRKSFALEIYIFMSSIHNFCGRITRNSMAANGAWNRLVNHLIVSHTQIVI